MHWKSETAILCGFLRNDHLTVSGEGVWKVTQALGNFSLSCEWKSVLPLIDILVLQTGHHIHAEDLNETQFYAYANETANYLEKWVQGSTNSRKTDIYFVTTSVSTRDGYAHQGKIKFLEPTIQ